MKKERTDLQQLWASFSKDVALAFLKRVIHPDMTLGQLGKALAFAHVQPHLAQLHLKQVVQGDELAAPTMAKVGALPAPAPTAVALPSPVGVKTPVLLAAPVVRRRRHHETQRVEEVLVAILGDQQAPMATPTLAAEADRRLPGCSAQAIGAVLRSLEKRSILTADRSRPRGWRLKRQGRRVPEPLVIRKASAASVAPPPAATVAVVSPEPARMAPAAAKQGGATVALLSQAEIQLAAEQLRKKFFAPSKTG